MLRKLQQDCENNVRLIVCLSEDYPKTGQFYLAKGILQFPHYFCKKIKKWPFITKAN